MLNLEVYLVGDDQAPWVDEVFERAFQGTAARQPVHLVQRTPDPYWPPSQAGWRCSNATHLVVESLGHGVSPVYARDAVAVVWARANGDTKDLRRLAAGEARLAAAGPMGSPDRVHCHGPPSASPRALTH